MPKDTEDCLFCKIVAGELPAEIVQEDEHTIAFMDINPWTRGHALVIPKSPARNLLDVDPDDLAHLAQIAQRVARAGMQVIAADGVTVQQFDENAGGQVVFHLHVHVIPRKEGVAMKPPASEKEKPDVLADQAKKLAAAMQSA